VELVKARLFSLIKRFTWLDWTILALTVGLLFYLTITGVVGLFKRPTTVEYLAKSNVASEAVMAKEAWVDVSGAVVAPGVYKLTDTARVKDALVAAGGFSSAADRDYIAKEINLAAKVSDGQKIYIPEIGTSPTSSGSVKGASTSKINLNKASLGELDSLWGVGAARAAEIIKNRPYTKVEDLVAKKVITKAVFEKIRDQVVVY